MPRTMNADDYRAALAALGLTQNAGSKLFGVNARTGQRWALGEADVPPPAARFLRYLIHVGADPVKVAAILDSIEGETPSRDDVEA